MKPTKLGTVNPAPELLPVWAHQAFLRAFWVATAESPEWIALRTQALLDELRSSFDIAYWQTTDGRRWEGGPAALADLVRSKATRDPDVSDQSPPAEGYSFTVSGAGPRVGMHVRIAAGAATLGRRHPNHTLTIDLREMVANGATAADGDAACAATATAWHPSTLALYDPPVNSSARRGGWKIPVGYRTWVSSNVGSISQVADGLTSTELAGGTLISAPDDWPADRVVTAMTATLAANGLEEVPH